MSSLNPKPRKRWSLTRRATLVVAALLTQALILSVGGLFGYRMLRDALAKTIEEMVLRQNSEIAERVARLLPTDLDADLSLGTADWDRAQMVLESLTDLPGEGFACLIDQQGRLVAHPEMRDNPGLWGTALGEKTLEFLDESADGVQQVQLKNADPDHTMVGRVDFLAEGIHYVATRALPGMNHRLLVHQKQSALIELGRERAPAIAAIAGFTGGLVLLLSGGGLWFLLGRYNSVVEQVNQRMRENLMVAQGVQRATWPQRVPPVPGFDLYGHSEPADETGGDTFDFIGLDADHRAVRETSDVRCAGVFALLADATGHGIGPAMSVTQLRSMLRASIGLNGGFEETLRVIDLQLSDDLPAGKLITAWFGRLDAATGVVSTFSAGQGPLLHYHAADGGITSTGADAPPLGIAPALNGYAAGQTAVAPGDLLLVASDGFYESANSEGTLFGQTRVEAVLRENAGRPSSQIAQQLRAAVDAFTDHAPLQDDRTVLLIRRLP